MRRNGSGPMTTRSSASTRSRRIITIPAGGKAARCCSGLVNLDKWNSLPKYYQSAIEQAGQAANSWMMAKYDQGNPPAMKKLLAGGTKLHAFSPAIMQASLKATKELYAETSAANPNFKKVLESMNAFTTNGYQWFQVAELGYDSFMARNPQG